MTPSRIGQGFRTALARASRGWLPAVLGCSLLLMAAAGIKVASQLSIPGTNTDRYLFGTLLTSDGRVLQEREAGVRVVQLELGWSAYEPRPGGFDPDYVAATQAKLHAFQAAGMKVVLGIGLQYPPDWVLNQTDSRYVNQYGVRSAVVNLTFNQALRREAERYINQVALDLDPNSFWAVRIGAGGSVEATYPPERDRDGHTNSYWAFDTNAQGGSNRPNSIPPSPYPGWQPGQKTHDGQAFTTAQVREWYDWYVRAMVDGVNWQIATYRAAGYSGQYQVLMPGVGSLPRDAETALNSYLDGTADPGGTLGAAAVWNRVVDDIADRRAVVAYVSSVADGSGDDSGCQPDDSTTPINPDSLANWSAVRWISYNADRYGMLKNGENPARIDTPQLYGVHMLQAALKQIESCGFQGLMWAHDQNLFDDSGPVSLTDYAALIAEARALPLVVPTPTVATR